MSYETFWELTIDEIKMFINAHVEKENDEFKNACFRDYRHADLVGLSVSRLFSQKNKYPKIDKVYPGMFKEKVDPIQAKIDGFLNAINAHNTFIKLKEMRDAEIQKCIDEGLIKSADEIPEGVDAHGIRDYISFKQQLTKMNNKG